MLNSVNAYNIPKRWVGYLLWPPYSILWNWVSESWTIFSWSHWKWWQSQGKNLSRLITNGNSLSSTCFQVSSLLKNKNKNEIRSLTEISVSGFKSTSPYHWWWNRCIKKRILVFHAITFILLKWPSFPSFAHPSFFLSFFPSSLFFFSHLLPRVKMDCLLWNDGIVYILLLYNFLIRCVIFKSPHLSKLS